MRREPSRGWRLGDDFAESVNRSADGMIRIYGSSAVVQARVTVTRMVALKDREGERMWQAIAKAIQRKQQSQES